MVRRIKWDKIYFIDCPFLGAFSTVFDLDQLFGVHLQLISVNRILSLLVDRNF